MTQYTETQIKAVQEFANLHDIEYTFNCEQCSRFLDWWLAQPLPGSLEEAIIDSLVNGVECIKAQRQKLIDIALMRG